MICSLEADDLHALYLGEQVQAMVSGSERHTEMGYRCEEAVSVPVLHAPRFLEYQGVPLHL